VEFINVRKFVIIVLELLAQYDGVDEQ